MPTEAIWPGFGELPVAKKVREGRRDGEKIYFPFLSLSSGSVHSSAIEQSQEAFPHDYKERLHFTQQVFRVRPKEKSHS